MNITYQLLISALLLSLAVYAWNFLRLHFRRLNIIRRNGCQPAFHYRHRDPVLGLDLFWQHAQAFRQHRFIEHTRQEFVRFGRTWQYTSFGREVISSIEPANFNSVMIQDIKSWGVEPLRFAASEPFLGKCLFTTDGPFWQHARNQVKPALAQARFSFVERVEPHLQRFLALIPRDGSTFDILPLLERFFTDTGTEFLLGDSVNSLTPDCSIDSKRFLTALEIAMSGTHGRHLLGKMVSLMPRDRKYHKACQFIHEVIDQQIENAFRSLKSTEIGGTGEHRLVLLHELVKQTTDKALIRGNILTVYAAGTESQATVISHVLFLLSRNPGVLLTLLDEIMTIGMKQPTLQEIKGLPFLKAVILEALRIYPLAPFSYRTALQDTILPAGGGPDGNSPLFVKKGSTYVISIHALHLDKGFWGDDAEEFKPERWITQKQVAEYQPFGGGPRTCPGQALAMTEMSYILLRILQEFRDIQSRDETPWAENLKMTLSNLHGVRISVTPA